MQQKELPNWRKDQVARLLIRNRGIDTKAGIAPVSQMSREALHIVRTGNRGRSKRI